MKVASLRTGGRDGTLIVVSNDLSRAVAVSNIAPTLQGALGDWANCAPRLQAVYEALQAETQAGTFPLATSELAAPLPRAYHWADGSAYLTHVERVRKARGAEVPASFGTEPLMYMGASDAFIGPNDNVSLENEDWGIDLEAEIAVITDDVPAGVSVERAGERIKLITLINDVSLRNLVPVELAKQFGFYQSKPWTSFAPVAVTLDELGDAWDGQKVHLALHACVNNTEIGSPNAGIDMNFSFPQLIHHAAKSRALMAGTVIGSGTVSNAGNANGSCCLAEVRALETITDGKPATPFLKFGDTIQIEMFDKEGRSIFGRIDQTVVRYQAPR